MQEALIKEHLGSELIGHLSRDGTAIEARERPLRAVAEVAADQADLLPVRDVQAIAPAVAPTPAKKRGRPRRGDTEDNIAQQLTMRAFLEELRGGGVETGGPAPFCQGDRQNFANQLDRHLNKHAKLKF